MTLARESKLCQIRESSFYRLLRRRSVWQQRASQVTFASRMRPCSLSMLTTLVMCMKRSTSKLSHHWTVKMTSSWETLQSLVVESLSASPHHRLCCQSQELHRLRQLARIRRWTTSHHRLIRRGSMTDFSIRSCKSQAESTLGEATITVLKKLNKRSSNIHTVQDYQTLVEMF